MGLDSFQCLLYFLFFGAERDADVTLTARTEDEAGGDEHACLVENTFGELLGIGIMIGDAAPKEHAYLLLIEGAAKGGH